MKLTNVELRIPEQMKQYIEVKDTDKELLRNALLLYPSIKDYTIHMARQLKYQVLINLI